MKTIATILFVFLSILPIIGSSKNSIVLLTDFGSKDGAVSAMKGVIYSVDKNIIVSDLTHEIPAFDIREASYRLYQTATYWPKGTYFVNVIDPGVGTERRSIVAKSKTGHFFVGPDNGTLTWVEEKLGIDEVREIDLSKHRLSNSFQSHTFFGRDVYANTAAKLASGKITFSQVGKKITSPLVRFSHTQAKIDDNKLIGSIVALDKQYGNVWTDIDEETLKQFKIIPKKSYKVTLLDNENVIYENVIIFHNTFGDVGKGEDLLYVNSLLNLAIASNQESFVDKYHVTAGPQSTIKIESK